VPELTYLLIMLAALGAGFLLARREQRQLPLEPWQKIGLAIGAACGGILGGKLPFVLGDAVFGSGSGLVSGTAWFADGKTITFGLVGGYLGVEVAKWALDIRVKTGDSFAVPAAVAVGLGRFGCFAAGCCYGLPTDLPWGVRFHDLGDPAGVLRHPTQLYEATFHLAAAACLLVLKREGLFRGQLIKLYFVIYFAYRFATEFLRPEPRVWAGLTAYQYTAFVMIPLFLLLWWWDRRSVMLNTSLERQASRPRESAVTRNGGDISDEY
jgi:phosphatidylglycerol---prolipoprotein diacylglyceryl transferase